MFAVKKAAVLQYIQIRIANGSARTTRQYSPLRKHAKRGCSPVAKSPTATTRRNCSHRQLVMVFGRGRCFAARSGEIKQNDTEANPVGRGLFEGKKTQSEMD